MTHQKKSHIATLAFLLCVGAASWPPAICAGVPEFFTYQGRLEQGAIPFTGNGLFKFAIVTSSGGVLYTHDGSAGPEPSQGVVRSVDRGIFTVHIGSPASPTENMRSVPTGVFAEPRTFLRVWVAAPTTAPIEELIEATFPVPHAHQFASVPYSVTAQQLASGTTQIIQQVIITSATVERIVVESSATFTGPVNMGQSLKVGQGTIFLGGSEGVGGIGNTVTFTQSTGDIPPAVRTSLNSADSPATGSIPLEIRAGSSGSVLVNPAGSSGDVALGSGGGKVAVGKVPDFLSARFEIDSAMNDVFALRRSGIPFLWVNQNDVNGGLLGLNTGSSAGNGLLTVRRISGSTADLLRLNDPNSSAVARVDSSGSWGTSGSVRIGDSAFETSASLPGRLGIAQAATGGQPLLNLLSGSPLVTRFVVQPDGKVGIGKLTPDEFVDVGGDVAFGNVTGLNVPSPLPRARLAQQGLGGGSIPTAELRINSKPDGTVDNPALSSWELKLSAANVNSRATGDLFEIRHREPGSAAGTTPVVTINPRGQSLLYSKTWEFRADPGDVFTGSITKLRVNAGPADGVVEVNPGGNRAVIQLMDPLNNIQTAVGASVVHEAFNGFLFRTTSVSPPKNLMRIDNNGTVHSANGFSTGSADLAERFETAVSVSTGEALVVDPAGGGRLTRSTQPRDPTFAGIASARPGLTLGNEVNGQAVAISGRVPARLSAENGPIHPGTRLTTASTPGHLMAADPHTPAEARVGLALGSLESGTGLVEILLK